MTWKDSSLVKFFIVFICRCHKILLMQWWKWKIFWVCLYPSLLFAFKLRVSSHWWLVTVKPAVLFIPFLGGGGVNPMQGGTCCYGVYLRTVCFLSRGRSWFQLQFFMVAKNLELFLAFWTCSFSLSWKEFCPTSVDISSSELYLSALCLK